MKEMPRTLTLCHVSFSLSHLHIHMAHNVSMKEAGKGDHSLMRYEAGSGSINHYEHRLYKTCYSA